MKGDINMDYRKDTAYVVGNQVIPQSQLNNNMSGTDANAIYQATHDQSFAPEYNQPYMQNYLADLAKMGLQNYNGQQTPDINPGAYVTGAGAFMMPSSIGTEQVLPRGMGSWEGLPSVPGSAEQAQQYAAILGALMQSGGTFPSNANAIQKEATMVGHGIL